MFVLQDKAAARPGLPPRGSQLLPPLSVSVTIRLLSADDILSVKHLIEDTGAARPRVVLPGDM